MTDPFELEILSGERAVVYLSCPDGSQLSWELVRLLDQVSIRVVGDLPEADASGARARRIMAGCAGVVGVLAYRPGRRVIESKLLEELRQAAALNLPLALFVEKDVQLSIDEHQNGFRLQAGSEDSFFIGRDRLHGPTLYLDDRLAESAHPTLAAFANHVLPDPARVRPYAFLVGRLERDFAQAREAVRVAVERDAGIPCLWSDDGRHRTNVASVRERTRLLIKHASFVIADLTLGSENPGHENPSRAHEIGMAVAYDRPIMLCSQEPRRYPYFSVADMQMTFWATEAELANCVSGWIHAHREAVARQVFNYRLGAICPESRIRQPVFDFDPAYRYIGPATKSRLYARAPVALLVSIVIFLLAAAMVILVLVTGSR